MAAPNPHALAGLPPLVPLFPDPYVDDPATDLTDYIPNARGKTAGCYNGTGFSETRLAFLAGTRPSILPSDQDMRESHGRYGDTRTQIINRNNNAPGPNADGTPNVYGAASYNAVTATLLESLLPGGTVYVDVERSRRLHYNACRAVARRVLEASHELGWHTNSVPRTQREENSRGNHTRNVGQYQVYVAFLLRVWHSLTSGQMAQAIGLAPDNRALSLAVGNLLRLEFIQPNPDRPHRIAT